MILSLSNSYIGLSKLCSITGEAKENESISSVDSKTIAFPAVRVIIVSRRFLKIQMFFDRKKYISIKKFQDPIPSDGLDQALKKNLQVFYIIKRQAIY